MWQRFEYDWLGNLSETDDDAHGFYDRSLGTQSHANAGKPYQLSSATNATQAAGGPAGNVTTNYDVAGNLRRMAVARTTTTARPCLPTGNGCNQYYAYDYDEVGRCTHPAICHPKNRGKSAPCVPMKTEIRSIDAT